MSYVVVNIGCLECGVSSNIVGVFSDEKEAERIARICHTHYNWREGGQNSFQVFKLPEPGAIHEEYPLAR